MSFILTQRGAAGHEPGIVEFPNLQYLGQYRHRSFPPFLFNSTTVEALAFRDRVLFAADDQLLYEFRDPRNLYSHIRRVFPSSIGDIVALTFDSDNTMWVLERGANNATDQRIRFNDATLADLTDFDRFTLNDTSETYTGMTIVDSQMMVASYSRGDTSVTRMRRFTGNFEAAPDSTDTLPSPIDEPSGLATMGDKLVLTDGTRRIYIFDDPTSLTAVSETYGPLETALFTQADGIAFADLDPEVDTGVAPIPVNGSIPYTGRVRLSGFPALGAGSPVGQQRRITNARVGVYRSSGGNIFQAGEKRAGKRQQLVEAAESDPLSPNGYRVFSGEVSRDLHDLGTDPTATVQIEQGREYGERHDPARVPHDLHITYIALDTESED